MHLHSTLRFRFDVAVGAFLQLYSTCLSIIWTCTRAGARPPERPGFLPGKRARPQIRVLGCSIQGRRHRHRERPERESTATSPCRSLATVQDKRD
ncbi:hypothetical protein F5883DRAFT_549909 [Diaporthe sp. PMI_573]|nr:hypothetical protein F5883DRAFT_549909 [Diaporthaceae sp. PMI_573]